MKQYIFNSLDKKSWIYCIISIVFIYYLNYENKQFLFVSCISFFFVSLSLALTPLYHSAIVVFLLLLLLFLLTCTNETNAQLRAYNLSTCAIFNIYNSNKFVHSENYYLSIWISNRGVSFSAHAFYLISLFRWVLVATSNTFSSSFNFSFRYWHIQLFS